MRIITVAALVLFGGLMLAGWARWGMPMPGDGDEHPSSFQLSLCFAAARATLRPTSMTVHVRRESPRGGVQPAPRSTADLGDLRWDCWTG